MTAAEWLGVAAIAMGVFGLLWRGGSQISALKTKVENLTEKIDGLTHWQREFDHDIRQQLMSIRRGERKGE